MRLRQFNLEIASISTCNMACTYCFEGEELKSKKQQLPESIPDIVSKVQTLIQNKNFNNEYPDGICINFWGGEPTLNFNWNKQLIDAIKELPELDEKVSYFIYTNGYGFKRLTEHLDLFTPKQMLDNKIRIQISWDGIENGRVNHLSNTTNETVRRHIKTIALMYPELSVMTKATIQPHELLRIEEIWTNHYNLLNDVKRIDSKCLDGSPHRTVVTFSPTLNYVDDFDDTDPVYLKRIDTEFQRILVLEKAFYQKHGYHLFEWFSANAKEGRSKRLTNCSAGINLMAIDFEGNFSSCHGVLYSKKKESFENFHDMQLDQDKEVFVRKFFSSREALKQHTDYVSNECISCEATVCYKCPVINIDKTSFHPRNYQVRDTRHCQIYKLFGRYDRVLMSILNTQNTKPTKD